MDAGGFVKGKHANNTILNMYPSDRGGPADRLCLSKF